MHQITTKEVIDTLKNCFDPEISINIVDLGLIYGINIDKENNVKVKLTMTSPMCPVTSVILADVQLRLKNIPDIGNVEMELAWEPLWNPEMINPNVRQSLGA